MRITSVLSWLLLLAVTGCDEGPQYTQRSTDARSPRPVLISPGSDTSGGADLTGDLDDPDGDLDEDGLLDIAEDQLVAEYLPYISIHPLDRCDSPRALVYRVSPHPTNPDQIAVRAALLFERACGLQPGIGSVAGFGFSVDPREGTPSGLRALVTRSCVSTETCSSTCASEPPCRTTSTPRGDIPIVYLSKDDHNTYLSEATCTSSCNLSDVCTIGTEDLSLIAINVGEPSAPRVDDLTTAGVINTQNGWSEERLMGIDPWSSPGFGDAQSIASIIASSTFIAPGCSAE